MEGRHAHLRSRLGNRLRELRRTRTLSQEQLAARAGLSYKFVGEVERGLGNPTVDTLAALADALETDVTDLFGPSEVKQLPPGRMLNPRGWASLKKAASLLTDVVESSQPPRRRPSRQ
jgi:transcriptional regulator with XRE-family HTH domain